jgi:DNA-binding IclR family transcriptional regulator
MSDKIAETDMKKKANYYHISSLEKGIHLLKLLAERGTMSLSEIAGELGIDRSGCHRYLLTFRDLGLVKKAENSKYVLTTGIFEITVGYLNRLGLRQSIRPFMEELSNTYKESVNLGIKDGDQIVFLDKIASPQDYRTEIAVGTRVPIYCTGLGKAIIAFRPDKEQMDYLRTNEFKRFTPNTITQSQAFEKELCLIRERGFSIDKGEYRNELLAVASPIVNSAGHSVYSISVAGPVSRFSEEMIMRIGCDLKDICSRISKVIMR